MSASRMPTLAPSFASASARLTAVVDLPTPPLPDAIATMFLTPRRFWLALNDGASNPSDNATDPPTASLSRFVSSALSPSRRITERHVDFDDPAALFDPAERAERLPRVAEVRVCETFNRVDARHDVSAQTERARIIGSVKEKPSDGGARTAHVRADAAHAGRSEYSRAFREI